MRQRFVVIASLRNGLAETTHPDDDELTGKDDIETALQDTLVGLSLVADGSRGRNISTRGRQQRLSLC